MNKRAEIQVDKDGFYHLEGFIDGISDEFHLRDTYYGNISAALTKSFDLFINQVKQKFINIQFEARHEGLVFSIRIDKDAFKQTYDSLPEDTRLFMESVTDDYVWDEEEGFLRLYFDTKSVFSLTAKYRSKLLNDYLAGRKTETVKKNDYFQRH